MATYINPKIITWARERSGYSIDQLAEAMHKEPNEVYRWESGEKSPSYLTLDDLAYKYFKIPLAVFFFPEPPNIEDPVSKFRRLSDYEMTRLSPDTIRIIRLSQGYQDSLNTLIDPDSIKRRIFKDINTEGKSPIRLAAEVRAYLRITIEQQMKFAGTEIAFKTWRHAVEDVGIFTFKDSFKDRFISGFSLLDSIFPIIVINNSNAFSRQIFTLIHELGHIIYNVDGVTDIEDDYIDYMDDPNKQLEINCNAFASELLVPTEEFINVIPKEFDIGVVGRLADKYSVSREVILRKYLDLGKITRDFYLETANEWNKDYLRSASRSPGGNWYLTMLSYLGEGYTRLVFDRFYHGEISKEQLGEHLNVNSKNVDKLESYLYR